jgi:hypothetical protein
MMTEPRQEPKLLFFDIETLPNIVAAFSIQGKQNISHKQILKRSQVMCISWAWGDGKVQHDITDMSRYDWYKKDDDADMMLVSNFVEMAQEADMVIGQNSSFDIGHLRSRLVKYSKELNNLDFRPTLIDDTYYNTKDIYFDSHKLDDVGDYLGYGNKDPHGDGYEWWIDVMRGDTKRLDKMVYYCDGDVKRTRKVYKRIKPFIKSSLNKAVWFNRPDACPSCGQSERPLIIRKYNQKRQPVFQCPVCNAYPFTKGKSGVGKKETGHPMTEYNR